MAGSNRWLETTVRARCNRHAVCSPRSTWRTDGKPVFDNGNERYQPRLRPTTLFFTKLWIEIPHRLHARGSMHEQWCPGPMDHRERTFTGKISSSTLRSSGFSKIFRSLDFPFSVPRTEPRELILRRCKRDSKFFGTLGNILSLSLSL